MDLGLKGKVALVAAASAGLGFGVARALAADGARVSICGRKSDAVDAAVQKLTDETGAEVIGTAADVSKPADIARWVDSTVSRWGVVDALLVNAGGPPAGNLMDFTDDQWQAAFELTLMSSVRMIRSAVPHMTNGGSILTVTSSSVQELVPRLGLSGVMRLGVVGLVENLADELADRNIRVNNLIPGRIDTDRVKSLDQGMAEKTGKSFDQVRQDSIERIPLKRLGTIDDFGAAAAFLLSPTAAYITGANLRVDGGALRAIT
jgi:3-oxoacyl-[acyl-carrier protein] reductase